MPPGAHDIQPDRAQPAEIAAAPVIKVRIPATSLVTGLDAAREASVDSDAAQFHELYEVHFDAVSSYARARADPDMAKDATAQTFLVAWRRRAEFFGARHPLGWLLGVTRRTLAGERRAASRQSGLRDRVGAAVAPRWRRCRTILQLWSPNGMPSPRRSAGCVTPTVKSSR